MCRLSRPMRLIGLLVLFLSLLSQQIPSVEAAGSHPLSESTATPLAQYTPKLKEAPISSQWADWVLKVDFPKDHQVRAIWTIHIGEGKNGSRPLLGEKSYELDCQTHGKAQIQDGRAIFNSISQDYITCEMPDFRLHALELFKEKGIKPPKFLLTDEPCRCNEPWVAASFKLNSPSSRHPLIYTGPDVGIRAYINNSSGSTAQTVLRVLDTQTKTLFTKPSDAYLLSPSDWTVVWSGYGLRNFWRYADWAGWDSPFDTSTFRKGPSFGPPAPPGSHWANNVWRNPEQEPMMMDLSMHPATIYIGHAPNTQLYFDGEIEKLGIDPPCVSQ